MTIQIPKSAYPLTWPAGIPRTKFPETSAFHTISKQQKRYPNSNETYTITTRHRLENLAAYRQLAGQLNLICGVRGIVISSNLHVNEATGLCYADGPVKPEGDAGVAAYWQVSKHRAGQNTLVPYCMPCDKWDRVADNLSALAHSVEALRGMERWGCVSVEQAFSGFAALPPGSGENVGMPEQPPIDWRAELAMGRPWPEGLASDELLAIVSKRYRTLLAEVHPDRPGGSTEKAARANAAFEAAEKELG